jgi:hypothetical protein
MKPRLITRAEREARKAGQPMRGLGDLVAKVTGAIGIKPCVPCKTTRKDYLNRLVPFSTRTSKPPTL